MSTTTPDPTPLTVVLVRHCQPDDGSHYDGDRHAGTTGEAREKEKE